MTRRGKGARLLTKSDLPSVKGKENIVLLAIRRES